MENNQIITVYNDKGKAIDMEFIDNIKVDGNEYVIAGPKNSDEAYAYKMVMKNGEVEYSSLGPGAEFKRVLDKYNQQ